jgi:hypothetical protein
MNDLDAVRDYLEKQGRDDLAAIVRDRIEGDNADAAYGSVIRLDLHAAHVAIDAAIDAAARDLQSLRRQLYAAYPHPSESPA